MLLEVTARANSEYLDFGLAPHNLGSKEKLHFSREGDGVLLPISLKCGMFYYPLDFPKGRAHCESRVLLLFTDTGSAWYSLHHPDRRTIAVTVIQRASSHLRLNPHFQTPHTETTNQPGF